MNVPTVKVEFLQDNQRVSNQLIQVTLCFDDDIPDRKISASMDPAFNEDGALNRYVGIASTFEGAFIGLAKDIRRRAEFTHDQKMRDRARGV